MNTTIIDITPAADYMEEHGWTQRKMQSGAGRVCLTGALKYCDMRPGDWLLARGVFRHLDRAEAWNDSWGRTKAEVLEVLRTTTITDELMEATYGPRWRMIVKLVRRVAAQTREEEAAAWKEHSAGYDSWQPALTNALVALQANGLRDAGGLAGSAAYGAASSHLNSMVDAQPLSQYAAWAVVARDLISPDQFEALTAPIRAAFGQDFFDNEQEEQA